MDLCRSPIHLQLNRPWFQEIRLVECPGCGWDGRGHSARSGIAGGLPRFLAAPLIGESAQRVQLVFPE